MLLCCAAEVGCLELREGSVPRLARLELRADLLG
jgi:hypothetical protein